MKIWIVFLFIAVGADHSTIEQAFNKNGVKGVIAAAKALEKDKGEAEASRLLAQCLRDRNVALSAAVASAIGQMGDAGKSALPELVAAFTDDESGGELAKELNTLNLGDIPIWLAEAALYGEDDNGNAYTALECLGVNDRRLVPILQKGLASANNDVQWNAVCLLADLGAKAAPARQSLIRLLEKEPNHDRTAAGYFSPNNVRAKAAYALGCIGEEPDQTVRLLLRTLKHHDPEIRISSALGLGRLGSKAHVAIPDLIACLGDEQMRVESGGCIWSAHPDSASGIALVEIGPAAIPGIVDALDANDVAVRLHAANAIRYFDKPTKVTVDALIKRLYDSRATVRRESVISLRVIVPEAKRLASEMVRLALDSDANVREAAATTLGCLHPSTEVPVEPLIRLIDDPAPIVRSTALRALGRVTRKGIVLSAGEKLKNDPDESVRRAASEELSRLNRLKDTPPAASPR